MKPETVLVVGAGLSGLATAWYLTDAGRAVHVVESAGDPGGLIHTRHVPEGLVETAARGFTWTPRMEALFRAAGVATSFARDESKRRYIFRGGRARRWPLGPIETAGAAARFGRAWVRRRARPGKTETVAAWATRVLGASAATWVIAPALQGIYASPPDALSAHAIFGKRGPARGKLVAPPNGMGELIDALYQGLRARGVTFDFGAPVDRIDAAQPTVICTNAPAAARLLAPGAPELSAAIQRIRMVSLVTITAFFAPRPDDLRGFGVLFPRTSGVRALGVLFNADIFSGRSALRSETWIYGDRSAAALPKDDADAASQVVADRTGTGGPVGRAHRLLRHSAARRATGLRPGGPRCRSRARPPAGPRGARRQLPWPPRRRALAGRRGGRRRAGVRARSGGMTVIRLSELPVGARARFHEAQLDPEACHLLQSLGLTAASSVRLCKNGEPCIVQVRSTRIGLSKAVAGCILVVPETESAS